MTPVGKTADDLLRVINNAEVASRDTQSKLRLIEDKTNPFLFRDKLSYQFNKASVKQQIETIKVK